MHHSNIRTSFRNLLSRASPVAGKQTDEALYVWLVQKNAEFGKRTDEEWRERFGKLMSPATVANVLEKAHRGAFYLGLEPDWLTPHDDDGAAPDE